MDVISAVQCMTKYLPTLCLVVFIYLDNSNIAVSTGRMLISLNDLERVACV